MFWTYRKMGQGQPRVIFVELESPMLYAKYQGHRNVVLEKKIFKGFYHIWPSWSRDLDHLYKLLFSLPKEAPHKIFL